MSSAILDDVQDYESVVNETYNRALAAGFNKASVPMVSVALPFSSTLTSTKMETWVIKSTPPSYSRGQLMLDLRPGSSTFRTFVQALGDQGTLVPIKTIREIYVPGSLSSLNSLYVNPQNEQLVPESTRTLGTAALSFKELIALPPADFLWSRAFVHDIGISGSFWMSNGVEWRPINPVVLAAPHFTTSKSDSDTNFGTLFSLVIPGRLLGTNGSLRLEPDFGFPSSATSKNLRVMLGSATPYSKSRTTTSLETAVVTVKTRGHNFQQYPLSGPGIRGVGQTSTIPTSSLDLTQDQVLLVQASFGTAGSGSNQINLTACPVILEY